jgi:hypothetical protein
VSNAENVTCPACKGTRMMDGGGGSRIPCDLCVMSGDGPSVQWQPMDTAPKDGRPILLLMPAMKGWLRGAWRGSWSHIYQEWGIHTPLELYGKVITVRDLPCPEGWTELPEAPHA